MVIFKIKNNFNIQNFFTNQSPYFDDAWNDYIEGGDNPKLYTAGD
jgi:hypothetical protein